MHDAAYRTARVVQGFYRQGVALKALGRFADSKAAFMRARELDPSDAATVAALEEVSKMKATDFMPEVDGDEGDKVGGEVVAPRRDAAVAHP